MSHTAIHSAEGQPRVDGIYDIIDDAIDVARGTTTM
jgi:hypothetical protein